MDGQDTKDRVGDPHSMLDSIMQHEELYKYLSHFINFQKMTVHRLNSSEIDDFSKLMLDSPAAAKHKDY